MEITARCIFDYESIKAVTYISIYKRKNPQKAFFFMNIWCVALALIILLEMYIFGVDKQLVFLLMVTIILELFNVFLYFGYARIQYNALHHMKNVENTYTFYEDLLKVSSKGAEYSGEAELRYIMVPKVMETTKYLFIFQSKNQAFIVDKSTITNGTIDDVREKLIPLLQKKYIICNY